jgi:hypothetical protein
VTHRDGDLMQVGDDITDCKNPVDLRLLIRIDIHSARGCPRNTQRCDKV